MLNTASHWLMKALQPNIGGMCEDPIKTQTFEELALNQSLSPTRTDTHTHTHTHWHTHLPVSAVSWEKALTGRCVQQPAACDWPQHKKNRGSESRSYDCALKTISFLPWFLPTRNRQTFVFTNKLHAQVSLYFKSGRFRVCFIRFISLSICTVITFINTGVRNSVIPVWRLVSL